MGGAKALSETQQTWAGRAQEAINQACKILSLSSSDL